MVRPELVVVGGGGPADSLRFGQAVPAKQKHTSVPPLGKGPRRLIWVGFLRTTCWPHASSSPLRPSDGVVELLETKAELCSDSRDHLPLVVGDLGRVHPVWSHGDIVAAAKNGLTSLIILSIASRATAMIKLARTIDASLIAISHAIRRA